MSVALNSGADHYSRPRWRAVDGVLLLDKPHGLSSNQALQRVRRCLAAARGGHAGSLDPLATGMLPVCLGEATKFSSYLLDAPKVYRTRLVLGQATASGDAEGPVTRTGPSRLLAGALEAALVGFRGTIDQVPPMYSALKRNGQPLYKLARQGVVVERAPRKVHISRLDLLAEGNGEALLEVACSKGTYIRTLVEDIAGAAGTVAHVGDLRRLAVSPYREDQMVSLDVLEAAARSDDAEALALLLPVDSGLAALPAQSLTASQAGQLCRGQVVHDGAGHPEGLIRLYGPAGGFIGLGEYGPDQLLRARRLLATGSGQPHQKTLNGGG